ncbi:MAG: hypothetical protein IKU36_12865 [Bacteroidales bacterium]|nr:hypothetical protein [Bacteroidales bacterium]
MKRFAIIAVLAAFCVGAHAQEKLYEVKSGKITMEMDMMGQTMVQEVYFDDYGAKQATVMDRQGQKTRQITQDGSNIMIDDAAKTATKMPAMGMMGGGRSEINWSNLDEKTIKKNKIEETGEETVAGKTCKVYKYKVMMMGQAVSATACVYKGIVLKSSTSTDFGEMGQKATKIEENITIDPSMFTIPEGVKVQEMDMSMFGGGF